MIDINFLIQILAPIITGVTYAEIYVWRQKKLVSKGLLIPKELDIKKDILADFCETLVLKGFLPVIIIESLIKQPLDINLLVAFLVGLGIPLLSILIASVPNKIFRINEFQGFKFLVSTFGGGNRGMIFLIIVFGNAPNFNELVKYFTIIDMGNFVFLLLVVPLLLKKSFGGNPRSKKNIFTNYSFLIMLFVSSFFIFNYFQPIDFKEMTAWLEKSASTRKFLFTMFAFMALSFRTRLNIETFRKYSIDLIPFLITRGTCIVLILLMGYLISLPEIIRYLSTILLLLPPSSILPSLLNETDINENSRSYVNSMALIINIIYLFIILAGLIIVTIMSLK